VGLCVWKTIEDSSGSHFWILEMVKNSDLFDLNRGHCCSEAFGKKAMWTQKF
jgi:hypothetical protein